MQRFKRILCVVSPDQQCQAAVDWASEIAENNAATLTIADSLNDDYVQAFSTLAEQEPLKLALQNALQSRQDELNKLTASIAPPASFDLITLKGLPYLEVIRQVLRGGHDLVVKIAEPDSGIKQRLFGSNDMHLLRKCPCPVLLVKPGNDKKKKLGSILAAIDINEAQQPGAAGNTMLQDILDLSTSLSVSEMAELHIVHAWQLAGETVLSGGRINLPHSQLKEYAEKEEKLRRGKFKDIVEDYYDTKAPDYKNVMQPVSHLVQGNPKDSIPALASKLGIDLVVMGTVGRTGIPGVFIGNTAETILSRLECSVLAIKPAGFKTPVTLD